MTDNWYLEAKNSKTKPIATKEMRDWFIKRTNRHISLVQKYCKKIMEAGLFPELADRLELHDLSKFEEPEFSPYVFITWKYKCKADGIDFETPDDLEEKMYEATEHHVLNNSHHPEYHCGKKSGVINKENRDAPPKEIIDAKKMPDLDIAEMIADWCGVSEERGTSPKTWADKNVGKRWEFTDQQSSLIYTLIDLIWE